MDNNNMSNNGNPYESKPQGDNNVYRSDNSGYQQSNPYTSQPYGGGQQNYQGYNQNYYAGLPQEPQKASGLAIASMVCGIISIVICCVWYLAAPLAIAAIVMGIINNVKQLGGKGMAIAGIITGVIGLLLVIALFVIIFAGVYSGDFDYLLDY